MTSRRPARQLDPSRSPLGRSGAARWLAPRRRPIAGIRAALVATLASLLLAAPASAEDPSPCVVGATLATGSPDPAIFAREASRGVRAFWCETYDSSGHAVRAGAYWETYPDGSTRTLARYVDSRIEGPVEIFDEDGRLWLRGELQAGDWSGPLDLFHENGAPWLSARFRIGQLDGPVETRFPDGSIESRTLFQGGREDGVATSYFPAAAGGGLRSQVRVEGDVIVERSPGRSPAEIGPSPMARLDAERSSRRSTAMPLADAARHGSPPAASAPPRSPDPGGPSSRGSAD